MPDFDYDAALSGSIEPEGDGTLWRVLAEVSLPHPEEDGGDAPTLEGLDQAVANMRGSVRAHDGVSVKVAMAGWVRDDFGDVLLKLLFVVTLGEGSEQGDEADREAFDYWESYGPHWLGRQLFDQCGTMNTLEVLRA